MSKQVQIRRDADTDVMAGTPALAELWTNTTKKRLHLGDGSTQGGIILPNMSDIRNQAGIAADDTGSANAVAIAPENPPGSYAAYQVFCFKPSANNTGATTLTVGALSSVAIKKLSGGSLVDLDADDLVAGVPATVIHNGSYFILQGTAAAASASSGLVLIETKTASGATSIDFTSGITSAYKNYKLVIGAALSSASGADDLLLRVRRSGQGSFDEGDNQYKSTPFGGSALVRTNAIVLFQAAYSNSGSPGISGEVSFADVSTAREKAFRADLWGHDGTSYVSQVIAGGRSNSSAIDGVQIRFINQNITATVSLMAFGA